MTSYADERIRFYKLEQICERLNHPTWLDAHLLTDALNHSTYANVECSRKGRSQVSYNELECTT